MLGGSDCCAASPVDNSINCWEYCSNVILIHKLQMTDNKLSVLVW